MWEKDLRLLDHPVLRTTSSFYVTDRLYTLRANKNCTVTQGLRFTQFPRTAIIGFTHKAMQVGWLVG